MEDLVKKWFASTIGILLALIIIYTWSHYSYKGVEISRLSSDEIVNVNSIIFGNPLLKQNPTDKAAKDKAAANKGAADKAAADKGAADKAAADKGAVDKAVADKAGTGGASPNTPDTATISANKAAALSYIFSSRLLTSAKDSLNTIKHFKPFDLQQFATVVSKYPFKVRSYFWLTGDSVYLEIIFWSLFGLIASLLYNVSEALRTQDFDMDEVAVHIAKFFYAPFCALVIYFCFDLLNSKSDATLSQISNGTIVMAFILGFFSGRTIELLNRVKELIFPTGGTSPMVANSFFVNGTITTVPPLNLSASIANADVKITSTTTSSFSKTIKPTAAGTFSFTNLPPDTYSITVTLIAGGVTYTGSEPNFQLNTSTPSKQSQITLK